MLQFYALVFVCHIGLPCMTVHWTPPGGFVNVEHCEVEMAQLVRELKQNEKRKQVTGQCKFGDIQEFNQPPGKPI